MRRINPSKNEVNHSCVHEWLNSSLLYKKFMHFLFDEIIMELLKIYNSFVVESNLEYSRVKIMWSVACMQWNVKLSSFLLLELFGEFHRNIFISFLYYSKNNIIIIYSSACCIAYHVYSPFISINHQVNIFSHYCKLASTFLYLNTNIVILLCMQIYAW